MYTTRSHSIFRHSFNNKRGEIILDLYKKPTDRNQYLLTSSCHPAHCVENIPFYLALRIVRVCTDISTRDTRHTELKNMLMEREYPESMVDNALRKAKAIHRSTALKKVVAHKQTKRPIFATLYDPRLPNLQKIQLKHWLCMTQDPYLEEVFPEPPLVAFRRQKNIKDFLARAKIPANTTRQHRNLNGMKKCTQQCTACPYIKEGTEIKGCKFKWNIVKNVNCETRNCVYMIECQKDYCKERYIGETERELRERISEHRGYIHNKNVSTATGEHFNLPGHQLSDMKVTIIEKVKKYDESYRKERESTHIRRFNTFYRGMNRRP